jgi:hypothetical protein
LPSPVPDFIFGAMQIEKIAFQPIDWCGLAPATDGVRGDLGRHRTTTAPADKLASTQQLLVEIVPCWCA